MNMTESAARALIEDGDLERWVHFGHPEFKANCVGVWADHGEWKVATTDERGALFPIKVFTSQGSALAELIRRAALMRDEASPRQQ